MALLAPGGPLETVLQRDLHTISYELDAKCDDCALNVYCLPEAARRRELTLLGVDAGAVRVMESAEVSDLDALAGLESDSESARRIQADPAFGESLQALVQKAVCSRHPGVQSWIGTQGISHHGIF